MGSLTRALEVETPLLLLLTSSFCADCRFLATGFGEAAALAPRARFATVLEENDAFESVVAGASADLFAKSTKT